MDELSNGTVSSEIRSITDPDAKRAEGAAGSGDYGIPEGLDDEVCENVAHAYWNLLYYWFAQEDDGIIVYTGEFNTSQTPLSTKKKIYERGDIMYHASH